MIKQKKRKTEAQSGNSISHQARHLLKRWYNNSQNPGQNRKAIFWMFLRNALIANTHHWETPDGTNQAKTPENTKTLPERIEAKSAPSSPTPASKSHPKVKHFLPVFNETNQPRSSRENILHKIHHEKPILCNKNFGNVLKY